jgi:hypothetical protein
MRIRVHCFPADDAAFRASVERAIAAGSGGHRASCDESIVEGHVRASYPACTVRLQHDLAALGNVDETVLYAYRDGGLRSLLSAPPDGPTAGAL